MLTIRSWVAAFSAFENSLFAGLLEVQANVSFTKTMTEHAVNDLLLRRHDGLHEALAHRPLQHTEAKA